MPIWLLLPAARLLTQAVRGISRALESPQRREARFRSEESENRRNQVLALIVGVLYSIAFWSFWLHLDDLTFVGFLLGVVVWLFSLMIVVLIAVAVWPVTVVLLAISVGVAISFAVLAMSERYVHVHLDNGGQKKAAGSQPAPEATTPGIERAATVAFHQRGTQDSRPGAKTTSQEIEHAAITVFRQRGTQDAATETFANVGLTAKGCKQRLNAPDYRDCEFTSKYNASISVAFYRGQAQRLDLTFSAERLDNVVRAVSAVYGQPKSLDGGTDDKDLTTFMWGTLRDSVSAGTVADGVHGWALFVHFP